LRHLSPEKGLRVNSIAARNVAPDFAAITDMTTMRLACGDQSQRQGGAEYTFEIILIESREFT
jgi:hypothetical protein